VLVLFFFRHYLARSVAPLFGVISFALIVTKEEIRRREILRRIGHPDARRRFLVVGAGAETKAVRADLAGNRWAGIDVVGEVDLNKTSVSALVELLHEHSVNGVIVNARHAYFDVVESAIRACELEGIEVLLIADFLTTYL
jgi:FlaA1/EpsC-like NDP-sugar epimerase